MQFMSGYFAKYLMYLKYIIHVGFLKATYEVTNTVLLHIKRKIGELHIESFRLAYREKSLLFRGWPEPVLPAEIVEPLIPKFLKRDQIFICLEKFQYSSAIGESLFDERASICVGWRS